MSFSLITEAPGWYVLFCLMAGAGYAAGLYFRDKRFPDTARWMRLAMAALRFATVSLIAFFLLSPLLRSVSREVEKPVIVIAQDNSRSIVLNKDSLFYRKDYPALLKGFAEDLADKYEVRTYSFGSEMKQDLGLAFDQKQTDISAVFSEVENRFANRNIGAVVLASDGLYNKGSNPVYASARLKAPVFTVALGDTTVNKDALISKVIHNKTAYLGNKFPVEVIVDSRRLKGKNAMLTVMKDSETLFSQKVDFNSDNTTATVRLQLDAKEKGLQHYRIRLAPVEGETNLQNNSRDVFVDILDGKQKILVLAAAPHPDIAAISETINRNDNYEAETYFFNEFAKPFTPYALVIVHRISPVENAKILSDLRASGVPVLYIAPVKTDPAMGVSITGSLSKTNDAECVYNKNFSLFTLSPELTGYFKKMPALQCPFGNYSLPPSSEMLLAQKIGLVETQSPLISFSALSERKSGIITGEGIWRWRLRDFADHNNHDLFNELIGKMVQYLSVKADKSFFRILAKNSFSENEPVILEAEVYNQSYELINEPEVKMAVTNADGKKFPFAFSKTANAYRLDAGIFPPGEYKYEAQVKVGDKLFTQRGTFVVNAIVAESISTIADHRLLFALASKHDGQMVGPNEMKKLEDLIRAREDIRPVIYNPKKLMDIINLKWIFFLLLVLLGLEWFIRKWQGAY